MEIEKIYAELNEKLADAERVLVGLGAEWKVKDEEGELFAHPLSALTINKYH